MMKAPAIVSALFATVAFAAVTPLTQMGSRNAETIKRDYSGSGTYYEIGLGACGYNNNDGQAVVAVSAALFDSYSGGDKNPNDNPLCGRQISLHADTGKPAQTATVVDRCTGCAYYDIDMSPSLFESVVGDLSIGRASISWNWA